MPRQRRAPDLPSNIGLTTPMPRVRTPAVPNLQFPTVTIPGPQARPPTYNPPKLGSSSAVPAFPKMPTIPMPKRKETDEERAKHHAEYQYYLEKYQKDLGVYRAPKTQLTPEQYAHQRLAREDAFRSLAGLPSVEQEGQAKAAGHDLTLIMKHRLHPENFYSTDAEGVAMWIGDAGWKIPDAAVQAGIDQAKGWESSPVTWWTLVKAGIAGTVTGAGASDALTTMTQTGTIPTVPGASPATTSNVPSSSTTTEPSSYPDRPPSTVTPTTEQTTPPSDDDTRQS